MKTQKNCCPSTCHAERSEATGVIQAARLLAADASLPLSMTWERVFFTPYYGPFAMAMMIVVVYVPGSVPGGIVTLTIIESPNCPRPECLAASKNFTGDGGGLPAGSSNG